MIKPEQVPDAVVDALLDPSNVGCSWKEAIAAALNAWPGAYQTTGYNTYFENLFDHVVIPLPQENSDDQ